MDETAFAEMATRSRRELHVYCYRMLGSFDEAEDLVQEVLLRAWRNRLGFEGRSSPRVWLYRIATNACLDRLRQQSRRAESVTDVHWLDPYPDVLLDEMEPGEMAVSRETVEIVLIGALQLLPPRQRVALILCDLLGWTAAQTATLAETTTTSVNSSLQRARATLRHHLPRRSEWTRPASLTAGEQLLLKRYVAAHERGDTQTVLSLLRDDLRVWMPPDPQTWQSRAAYADFAFSGKPPGNWRVVLTMANRQPAAAFYLRRPGAAGYQATAIQVLRLDDGLIAEIAAFRNPPMFSVFGLAVRLAL